jgi:hypothetical protein
MIRNVYCTSCTVSVFLVRFELYLNFLDSFSKNTQISWKSFKFEPSCSPRTDSGQTTDRQRTDSGQTADGQRTDTTKLIVTFRNLANASKTINQPFMNDGTAEVQGDGHKWHAFLTNYYEIHPNSDKVNVEPFRRNSAICHHLHSIYFKLRITYY